MESCWIFHPKYEKEIYDKVIRCFVNDFLEWTNNGFVWHMSELESEGWIKLTVHPDGPNEYYTETCWHDDPIASSALTDDMLVLLTEAGVAHHGRDEEEEEWYLEDVDLQDVLGALSKQGTHVYVPDGSHLWMRSTDTGGCEKISILDFILAQKVA